MRKSLKDISWDISEPNYRLDKSLSYSKLSQFFKNGPKALISNEKIDSLSLRFGSLVDCLLTATEEFDDRFYVADIDRFSATIRSMVEGISFLHKDYKSELCEFEDEILLAFLDEEGYQTNWKPETRIKKLIELGSDYYTVLKYSTGKIVISPQEFSEAQQCVQTLKTHPFTYQIFECNEDEEIFYQLKFKDEVAGVPARIMTDCIKVNHKEKWIQPYDLKTTGKNEEEFEKSYVDWNYSIQKGLYSRVMTQIFKNDDYYKDYDILSFKFIVINKNNLTPLVWDVGSEDNDGSNDYKLQTKLGINWWKLLEDANWHLQNGKFDYSRKSYENNGINPIVLKL